MKTLKTVICLCLFAGACAAVAADMVVLKSGRKLVGDVTETNANEITITTDKGVFTYPWDVVHPRTVRQFNPPLFEELKQKALERREALIREKGYVKYKGKWMTPEQKEVAEKRDRGLELFEDEWMPTGEVAKIKYARKMKAGGRVEYDGRWFTPDDLEKYKERELYRGLQLGMSTNEVTRLWGPPTRIKSVGTYASKPEMWFYVNEEAGHEDRVLFENAIIKRVQMKEPISN